MSAVLAPLLKTTIGPFEKHLKVKNLVELSVNQPGEVWLETDSGWQCRKDPELTQQALWHFARALATHSGQEFSETVPMLACKLPEYGYRVQVVAGAAVESGFALSIRCGAARRFPLTNYMSEGDARAFQEAIEARKTIVAAGGTGTGKTTFINSVIPYVPDWERIVTIEDTIELSVPHRNQVRLVKSKSGTDVAQVSYADLINATLRLRPERIIVGELTIENTAPFLRVINTGHGGSMSTVHADSPRKAIAAMVQNVQLAGGAGGGGAPPADVVEQYARQSIDYIVHLVREPGRVFKARVEAIEDV